MIINILVGNLLELLLVFLLPPASCRTITVMIRVKALIKFFDFLPGRLFEMGAYSRWALKRRWRYPFSHKIWGGQKRQLRKYFVVVGFSQ